VSRTKPVRRHPMRPRERFVRDARKPTEAGRAVTFSRHDPEREPAQGEVEAGVIPMSVDLPDGATYIGPGIAPYTRLPTKVYKLRDGRQVQQLTRPVHGFD